jgi:anthranilate phosphoribosyltransferase
MAEALARLGKRHALVFRGDDGLDELTTTGPSQVWEVRDGTVEQHGFHPSEVGIDLAHPEDLQGGGIDDNVGSPTRSWTANRAHRRHRGPQRGGGALAADAVTDLATGAGRAREVLASGAARELKDRWASRSQAPAIGSWPRA